MKRTALIILTVALSLWGSFSMPALAKTTPTEMATMTKGGIIVKEDNVLDKNAKGPATVTAKIIIPRPPEQIWPVVANPHEVMREERKVKHMKTITKTGNTQDVEYTVSYSTLLPTFNYVLRLENQSPSVIRFHRIRGSFKDINGSWELTPIDNGQKTILTYTLSIDPGFFAPRFLVMQAIKSDLPSMMKNVKSVIDKKIATTNPRGN